MVPLQHEAGDVAEQIRLGPVVAKMRDGLVDQQPAALLADVDQLASRLASEARRPTVHAG